MENPVDEYMKVMNRSTVTGSLDDSKECLQRRLSQCRGTPMIPVIDYLKRNGPIVATQDVAKFYKEQKKVSDVSGDLEKHSYR